MKKEILMVAMVGMVSLGMAQKKTVYLNSETTACVIKGIKKQCLQYKNTESDTAWHIYNGTIKGFSYIPGYSYTLQIQPIKFDKQQWQLVRVISKVKSLPQQAKDTVAMLSKPLAELIGRWNFTRMPADVGNPAFTKEFLVFSPTEMRMTGKASCNSFFGNYTADTTGDKKEIHFEAIGHTMMACDNLSTENKMLAAMEKITNWSIEGNKMYLKAGNTILIELTRVAESVI